ncbi:MAG: hypothetical protein LUC45_07745 [Paraprevotella sp.]|nr:hypothetical protein [Paraprevotella sp.]
MDNFRTGSPKNVSALTKTAHFKLVEHDITIPCMIKGIDEIYNLACPASPIMQALQGKDLTLYGDDRQTRSFQYVDDGSTT